MLTHPRGGTAITMAAALSHFLLYPRIPPRTVPLVSLRVLPPHNALSLVTSFLGRNGRFYIAGLTS